MGFSRFRSVDADRLSPDFWPNANELDHRHRRDVLPRFGLACIVGSRPEVDCRLCCHQRDRRMAH